MTENTASFKGRHVVWVGAAACAVCCAAPVVTFSVWPGSPRPASKWLACVECPGRDVKTTRSDPAAARHPDW